MNQIARTRNRDCAVSGKRMSFTRRISSEKHSRVDCERLSRRRRFDQGKHQVLGDDVGKCVEFWRYWPTLVIGTIGSAALEPLALNDERKREVSDLVMASVGW